MMADAQTQDFTPESDLLADCRSMLRFALREAVELPSDLLTDVARLDALLWQRNCVPIADIACYPAAADAGGVSTSPDVSAATDRTSSEELVLKVYGGLSRTIAPTTALTLRASEEREGSGRFMAGMPRIVRTSAVIAMVTSILFVATSGVVPEDLQIIPPMMVKLLPNINAFAGAALGAAFYVLLKSQPYLVNRSYHPRYNAAYASRFVIGVISGVILAIAIGPTLGDGAGKEFTRGVLAILGGYAAEAVELILQRMVATLLTVVRGDGSEQAEARLAANNAEQAANFDAAMPELEAARDDPEKFRAALQKARAMLRK